MANGSISSEDHPEVLKDMESVKETQLFIINNLGRFGIDPESTKDRENGDYWKWFRFYDNWKKGLSEIDWKIVSNAIKNNLPFNELLPTNTWKN